MTPNEYNFAARMMKKYGGSFASALGEAYLLADSNNQGRFEKAFPELFEKYAKFGDSE